MITITRSEKYSAFVGKELMSMKEDGSFSDFGITVNEKTFSCHKLMLAVHSPVLRAMMKSDMVESAKQSATLDDISPEIMDILLEFMYAEQVTFHEDNLMDVIKTSNYLQMIGLEEMCIERVPPVVKPENAVSWLTLGDKLNLDRIKSQCAEIIAANMSEISVQMEFLALSLAEVQECFNEVKKLQTSHDGILRASMNWVSDDQENRMTNLEDLLHEVEVDSCSLEVVMDVMDTYGTLVISSIAVHNLLTRAMKTIKARDARPRTQQTLVIIGGIVDGKENRVCWFLNKANRFLELSKIPFRDYRPYHSVCKTPEGFAITGGKDSDLCVMFNASTKKWAMLQNMLTERYKHASWCIKGVIYVFGGTISNQRSNCVDYLVIGSGNWQRGPDMPIAVAYPKVAELNGCVYLLESQLNSPLLKLDPEKKVWIKCAPLSENNWNSVNMASVYGKLCVAGGGGICAWYDPNTDTWCRSQRPVKTHHDASLAYHNYTLLLLGGMRNIDIEEYNTKDGTWTIGSVKMPEELEYHNAMVLNVPQED